MSVDALDGPRAARSLHARAAPLAAPDAQLARLAAVAPGLDFDATLRARAGGPLRATAPGILQINLGKLCNMACRHCHVDAGPDRLDSQMDGPTVDATLALLGRLPSVHTVDLTGGAPELHPRFEDIVRAAHAAGKHILDRNNLTVLLLPRFAGLPAFLAAHGVEVVASLPNPRAPNTDAQRGDGTFARSIVALRLLNAAGYGQGDPARRLTLMHNPAGALLPAAQASLERDYREELSRRHGVTFDRLIALNNMPIARFLEWLDEKGNTAAYLARLEGAFNPAAVPGLMCRDTLSISPDGRIHDCDFNQMLGLPAAGQPTVQDATTGRLDGRAVVVGRHCFGCTAGAGSSCGGATAG